MTDGKQISVAELLARNNQESGSAQNGGGRRRRAGKNGGVSVASLTGEFPVVQPAENPDPPAQPEQVQPVQPAAHQPNSMPMPAVQPVLPPPPAPQNMAPQSFAPTMPAQQSYGPTMPAQQPAPQSYAPTMPAQQPTPQSFAPTMPAQQPAPPQNFGQQQYGQQNFAPQQAAPQQFAIQPPTGTQAAPSAAGTTAAAPSYGFGEPSVAAPPAQPVKRRTRAERRAAEERERVQREAASARTSHARPEAAEQPAAEPAGYGPQNFPTVVTPPVVPQTHAVPQSVPAPEPMIDSSPTVLEPGSIPGFPPAAFDPVSQTYAQPNTDVEATAFTPAVPGKSPGLGKLRNFPLGRFGNQQRTDDAPTEIRQPDSKAKKGKAGKAEPQAGAVENAAEATSVWPPAAPAGAGPLQFDEAQPAAEPQPEPSRTPTESKSRKDKIRKPKKQPQRASAMDFPTAAWQMSSAEPQLLSGNTSVAGELLRQDPARSDQLRSDGMRSEALRSEPLRADAMRSEALRAEPQPSEALRPEPPRSEPIRSEQARSEPLQRADPQRPDLADQAHTELIHPDQLLAGPSLAGELMRGGPEEPFEPTEFYHNPQPDDQPTDVDHPFFSRGAGGEFHEPLDPDELGEEDDDREDAKRAWWIQVGQWLVAGVAGVLLFKGFEVLWVHMAMVALALAVTVILGLVALVRILRRTDDILSLGIAVVVGVFVTLGPLAFTLQTG